MFENKHIHDWRACLSAPRLQKQNQAALADRMMFKVSKNFGQAKQGLKASGPQSGHCIEL